MNALHVLDLAHRIGWPPIAALLTAGLAALLTAVGLLAADGGPGRHVRPHNVPATPHRVPSHSHARPAEPRQHALTRKAAAA